MHNVALVEAAALGISDALIASSPMFERLARELRRLDEGGQSVAFVRGSRDSVIYYDVPILGDPGAAVTDVLVVIADGYPGAGIDLAALPVGSPWLPRVKGGVNSQGEVTTPDGRVWQLCSYHPHANGGGPPWNSSIHGYHTYFDHVLAWLEVLS